MTSVDPVNAASAEGAQTEQDLGPLAWVLDELRKSLDGAVKALRRFVHEADLARESDLASLDVASLRMARQQLHQSGGALEMVGMASPALVLRAMEAAVQRFVQRPELCTDDAAGAIERACFALSEFLESVLAGKAVSPVALFPQYRDVQALSGVERVHPADLWPVERRFREPEMALPAQALAYGPATRSRLDQSVLRIVKDGDLDAARELRDVSLGLAAAQTDKQVRSFWKIGAGFFEAFSQGLIHADVYAKRVASRVLIQYSTLARGDAGVADRLVQDLLFFCAQARPAPDADLPNLQAVRKAFGLNRSVPVDYEARRFGRFDPAVLAQARKRISAAAETWSALAGGDRNKLKPAADQFSLVCDSLRKLHRSSETLAQALTKAMELTVRSGEPPAPALAMEVATSVLYLQAALEETDTSEEQMQARAGRLAERLAAVSAGAEPEPLEPWMEELYRRVSDNQTMGSVVGELRATLGEAERAMDQFFRNPEDTAQLANVPSRLAQMRGVLSVLGLDQASLAVLRMRDTVERLMVGEPADVQERSQTFEKLGNSLGALGFLIDMLSYQRAMARKLFVYDEELGELRLLMGRTRARAGDQAEAPEDLAHTLEERAAVPLPEVLPREPLHAVPATVPVAVPQAAAPVQDAAAEPQPAEPEPTFDALATTPLELPVTVEPEPAVAPPQPAVTLVFKEEEEDDELLGIFLEEAREVVTNGLAAIDHLRSEPGDLSEQTTLRRAFHTLKGSSRMVGLNEFGEAAWSLEQLLNAWLAEQKPVQPPLVDLSGKAMQAFGRWADGIAAGQAQAWKAAPFAEAADALRLRGEVLDLVLPGAAPAPAAVEEPVSAPLVAAEPELMAPAVVPSEEAPTTVLDEAQPLDAADLLEVPDFSDTAPLEFASTQSPPAEPAASVALAEEIDFSEFAAALDAPAAVPPEPVAEPAEAAALEIDFLLDVPQPAPEAAPAEPEQALEALPEIEAVSAPVPMDETVKAIGDLRISIPLYNVYLNEADEWSRRLVTALQEWALEPAAPVPDDAIALAHSLAGSSATVGFQALSQAARLLEHALEHAKLLGRISAQDMQTFLASGDDVRRLLHQFAAGFLKEADPAVLEALQQILAIEVVSTQSPSYEDAEEAMEAWRIENAQAMQAAQQVQAEEVQAEEVPVDTAEAVPAAPELAEPEETVPAVEPEPESAAEAAAATPEAEVPALPEAQETVAPPMPALVAPALLVPVAAPVPVQAEPVVVVDIDDEIDAVDVIDPDLFPIFEEEAAELLPTLGGALRQWAGRPDNLGARTEVLRALHTLKGSARLAGAMRLGEMSHRLESAIEQIDVDTVQASDVEPLLGSFDGLQTVFNALRNISAQEPTEPVVVTPVREEAPVATAAEASVPPVAAQAPATAPVPAAAVARPVLARPQALDVAPVRTASGHTIRVRAQLLDRLVNQAGEVMISRSRLEARVGQLRSSMTDLTGNLERLRQQLRDIELQSESQMQSRLALSKDSAAGFDPLEFDRFTRVQELTRMMAESVNDVATIQRNLMRAMEGAEDDLIAQGRQARELQRDLLRTRMVEFEGISERLYAVVRQASKETGKQIKLDITGGSIEMDRGVLDRMTPAFEHLLRNCVAHGIEAPDQRAAKGKAAVGSIAVALRHEGNDVSVEFRDDGAGLNLPAIRAKAQAQGLVSADAVLSDAEAANLIFTPGFSTASEVTGLAGRGIGMDVVRAEVHGLGGRIETQTDADKGTSFRMVLPLTTAVTQVVMLRVGTLAIGVPANLVEVVRRVPAPELESAYRNGSFDASGEAIPFFWCGALLQASLRSDEQAAGKTRPVVILRSAAQRVAMHVDEVLGNREVVVKNLGPQLSRLPGLAGMSVLPSGAVVLIYNPVALVTVYGERIRALAASQPVAVAAAAEAAPQVPVAAVAAVNQVPLVLVVDDSITVRRVTQRLLQREGYRVALAADGLQALEKLQEELPTVVLSDIEMPRMDGFDLARNIRADARLRDLPIIMITSRIAQKHREHAMELGVNHYLGKPYSDDELLSLIHHYAQLAQPAESA